MLLSLSNVLNPFERLNAKSNPRLHLPTINKDIKRPIKNENRDNWIKGLDPAINILNTSLPSGSVPSKWFELGGVGWGNISTSKPTIGSYILCGQISELSKYECKKLNEIKVNKNKELIWILEHEEIYTGGTSFSDNEILDKSINFVKAPFLRGFLCLTVPQKSITFSWNLGAFGGIIGGIFN